MKTEKKLYKYSILGKVKSLQLTVKTDIVSLRKQKLGIVPNLIHSMYASNIAILVNNLLDMDVNFPMFTIHDCFASNANFTELLTFEVKSAFVFIYKNQDFIEKYHNDTIAYLENLGLSFNADKSILFHKDKQYTVPLKPELNKTVDLVTNILNSRYFLK